MSEETSDGQSKKPIEKPQSNPAADFGRRVAKAAGGALPGVGSVVAEYFDAKLPNPTADDRARWEGEVTDNVNDLNSRVDGISASARPKTRLSQAASAIADYLVKRCRTGLGLEYVDRATINAALGSFENDDLADGLGDLESYGLIEAFRFLDGGANYRLTQSGYRALDPVVMGWDTVADAREIAGLVVKLRHSIRTSELEAELGWPRRRLNPALREVLNFVHPGRVSREIQADYATTQFFIDDAERSELRRFAAGQ